MPKNCLNCPMLGVLFNCRVVGNGEMEDNITVRRADCPLIEIPPHGSLIDMDDFLQECSELESYRTAMKLCEVIEAEPCNDLAKPNNDPTVIEAEGRE